MATIWLGNHNAIEQQAGGERAPLDGKRCTVVHPPADLTVAELIHDLTHPQGIWAAHSDADKPAWVASDDPALAAVLAAVFGCEVRDPEPEVTP